MNTIVKSGVTISVNINGKPTRTYFHEGKYFIESREGSEYTIKINNSNGHRVEVVGSVDGLSVLTGELASKADRGYIVPAWGDLVIKGYRADSDTVGAFKFVRKDKSYAVGVTGSSSGVGVIALAVYIEEPVWTTTVATYGSSTTGEFYTPPGSISGGMAGCLGSAGHKGPEGLPGAMYCSSLGATPISRSLNASMSLTSDTGFSHGTTWGSKIQDKVVKTTFNRSYEMFSLEVFYNQKENLEAMGIQLIPEKLIAFPSGFPKDYATPPPNWG